MWASPTIPEELQKHKALVILSGGLDSCVALAIAHKNHKQVMALTFGYNQRHGEETECAYQIARHFNISLETATFSPCTDSSLIFTGSKETRASREQKLPSTFVPGRNAIMLSIAAGYAYGKDIKCIYGGWNAVDYSGYPDCRPGFLTVMDDALNLALNKSMGVVEIMAPLLMLSKREIIELGWDLAAPLGATWSCYDPRLRITRPTNVAYPLGDITTILTAEAKPCGTCESCKIRAKGFKAAGRPDPAL